MKSKSIQRSLLVSLLRMVVVTRRSNTDTVGSMLDTPFQYESGTVKGDSPVRDTAASVKVNCHPLLVYWLS